MQAMLPGGFAFFQIKYIVSDTLWYNINGRDVQRKKVVNNVDKSSLWAPWQNGPYNLNNDRHLYKSIKHIVGLAQIVVTDI